MSPAKHSPLPWKALKVDAYGEVDIYNVDGPAKLIAGMCDPEDASLIVKSVNLHDELVAALEILVIKTSSDPMLTMGLQMTNEQINKMASELLKKARQ